MRKTSIIAAGFLLAGAIAGCSFQPDGVESVAISTYLNAKTNESEHSNDVAESPVIKNYLSSKKESKKLLKQEDKSEFRYFNIRTGDTTKVLFERMGIIDGKSYVIGRDDGFEAGFDANGIKSIKELEDYIQANDYSLFVKTTPNSRFMKVTILKSQNSTEKRLLNVPVSISGMPNIAEAIESIAHSANATVEYADKSAADICSVHRRVSFSGTGLDAIRQMGSKAGIDVEIKNDKVILSYFQTETMDVDIFMRDRNMLSALSNVPSQGSSSGTGSYSSSMNGSASSTTSMGGSGNNRDLSVIYSTKLLTELQNSINNSLSKYGTYSFLPTTGQVVVRDKAENIKTVQKIISNFNSKFKDTISGRVTFYKVTMEKTDKRGLDIKALIGNHFTLSTSSMVASAFPSVGSTTGNIALGVTHGNDTGLLQFLRELGSTEVVNSIDFETQSNSLKTLKVANNYGYISSVNSSTVAGGTGNTTSGGVTPSSVPDGTYASIIAKSIGNGTVAFDIYTTANSLSKFNTAEAFGTSVQTPNTAEQSVDGYHQVHSGVPTILLSYKYNETTNNAQGLPTEWGWLQKVGMSSDAGKDVFIIVALEAAIK